MIKTSWRLAHLSLAIITALFLFIASLTGVVLAIHAVNERSAATRENRAEVPAFSKTDIADYNHPSVSDQVSIGTKTDDSLINTNIGEVNLANFSNLAEYLYFLKTKYPGLTAVDINKYDQVIIETTDESFNQQRFMIHPADGRILSSERIDPPFVQWNLSLHRSLFLHNTGRFIVGIVSFLFIIIIISGVLLIAKRQKKLKKFFRKPKGGNRTAKWHVRLGQLFFIPLLITALTGTYLFMKRFQLLPEKQAVSISYLSENSTHQTEPDTSAAGQTHFHPETSDFNDLNTEHRQEYHSEKRELADFPALQAIKTTELKRAVFPFFDAPEEYYTLQLSDRELVIDPYSGTVVEETRYPFHALLGQLSFELHTGSGNSIWAIVLAIASLSIIAFMITGFVITYQRLFKRTKNQAKPADAEIVLLTGTENGSTRRFAEAIHQQLTDRGHKVYSDDMNRYTTFPSARHLIILTCTYGEGEAPSSARRFEKYLAKHPQKQLIEFSIVGFGSQHYPDFCAFAFRTHELLSLQSWARAATTVHTVNKRSASEFAGWANAWSEKSGIQLEQTPDNYKFRKKNHQ